MRQNNVLVIDDDKDLCTLLERELLQENFKVTVCNDGQEGVDIFLNSDFQLIVLDVMLPTINGFDILTKIRNVNNVPILMLTAKDSEVDKVSGLRLGADDYLTKPFLMSEFIARAKSLVRRYTVLNKENHDDCILTFKGIEIDRSLRTITVNDTPVRLTAKEFDLLYFLASNQGKIFTKEQIYTHVWQEDYSFDDRNIMSFISKLRRKINNDSLDMEYIQTIHSIGYRFNLEV
ncbi:two-component response regulator [YcbM] [Streptococcus thermophilus]|uniref:Transcriptional regulatory protein DltR n=1 Tax=Streptococcus thermophilus TaxID=1308 RepID=A0A8D6U816_STRTR|nr:response regulator transcription factor [Streptococcus thermophilus]CAD0142315.1 two-component response regulator [YcbM] [Streptococcus thermophilus]CAD0146661.1 two-component response regulator [YcbM] [Streptococcus thermophilus]CAD0149024.1 two-component response regulator [YcbM] [Streptococcus thermophilus]CAD0150676.1 two-component response regulator [YcbM] [Streptococcus thermophilus]